MTGRENNLGRMSPMAWHNGLLSSHINRLTSILQGKSLKEGVMIKNTILAMGLLLSLGAPAMAQVALNENDHITESLVAAQVGDILRKTCGSISARYVVVYQKMGELEDYARSEGYTEDEVKAFLKNKAEKARIKALAQDYLNKAGVVDGDEESYCKVGRDEIAKETLAGSLLKSWK